MFADRLLTAIEAKGTPAMVGLDPRWADLPSQYRENTEFSDLAGMARAAGRYCVDLVHGLADLVAVVKIQLACFEAIGSAGMEVLGQVVQVAKKEGLLVILDGKRNDIGSSAELYANAYLGKTEGQPVLDGDALTVNAYMGRDTLQPFLNTARQYGKGVFVLVRTSNPGAGDFQDLRIGERSVYEVLADWVQELGQSGECGYSEVGAVVGATAPRQLAELRARMPNAILLVPGYGTQGGTSADVAPAFDENGFGAVINNSRGILRAFTQTRFVGQSPIDAARAVTREMIADLARHTSAGRLRRC